MSQSPTGHTPSAHTVRSFDHEIDELRSLIGQMGGLAEAQVGDAVDALLRRDGDAAKLVVGRDAELDRMEIEAERMAVTIIALRAPMADDLREIVAALKISAIIERIGDYAKNIAKRVPVLMQAAPVGPSVIIPEMARIVASMIRDALDSYVDRDADLALQVMDRDQRVDQFYNSLFRSLLTFMMENPHHITASAHLLFIAKNLERVGDHATNIAEMVHFSVTGEHIAERTKTDDTATIVAPNQDSDP
ncbi:MAG: phosphate signaling complex protein PhoU [Sandarakinorhabdus sp.]|nr:phosphate signaling complex protein PhoU [Sandarakinorhabdus sp.]